MNRYSAEELGIVVDNTDNNVNETIDYPVLDEGNDNRQELNPIMQFLSQLALNGSLELNFNNYQNKEKEYLTILEAAERSGIPQSRIRKDINDRNIKIIPGCNAELIKYTDLVAYYDSILTFKIA